MALNMKSIMHMQKYQPECHYLITSNKSERAVGAEVTSLAVWVKEFEVGVLIWSGVVIKKG